MIVAAVAFISVVLSATLFILARQLGWTLGWLYVGLFAVNNIVTVVCVALWNPVLFARRMKVGPGTKAWDIVWLIVFLATVIALFVVARRDLSAQHDDPASPGIEWLTGAVLFVFGWMMVTWSMVVNPFFEKTVRIQTDHGHHVIDNGPYARIRHPGYVGINAIFLSTPLLLSSAWTLLPALVAVLAIVIRTLLEDRTLQSELAGYREYAKKVRYRFIPGVW